MITLKVLVVRALLLTAFLYSTTPVSWSQSQTTSRRRSAQKERTDPYPLDSLLYQLRTVRSSKGSFLTEQMIIDTLKRVGVAFQPTQEDLQKLRAEGASDALIVLVAEKGGLQPPSTAPPNTGAEDVGKPKQGRLTVYCKPVDCTVLIDGKAIGVTDSGQLKDFILPEGEAKVSAVVKDHISDREAQVVSIEDGKSYQFEFLFTVDPKALAAKAVAIHQGMITALGGEVGLKAAEFYRATGNLEIHSEGAQAVNWPFQALVRLPSRARFEVRKNNKPFVAIREASGFVWDGNRPQTPEFESLEDGLQRLLDNHITNLIDLINGPGVKATVEKLAFGQEEDVVLRVEREAYKYRIRLNPELRPEEIFLEAGGLSSGLTIVLSKYEKVAEGVLPMITEIIQPGGKRTGVVVKYHEMILNPQDVKDEDFRPRSRRRFF